MDDLIARLRARAADPARRTGVRPSQLGEAIGSLDLGGVVSMARGLGGMLRTVVAANQAGRVDPGGAAMADDLERWATTPVDTPAPEPAPEAAIARAERDLGVPLPIALRRVYAEVGDGGFGPGAGLVSLATMVATYRELQAPGMLPEGRSWPTGLLPLVSTEPGWDCVEAATGRVVAWDPDGLDERTSEARFRRSFREIHPSVEAWLEDWLGSRTHEEVRAETMARFQSQEYLVELARETRAGLARMTPDERANLGLPETGWEKVVMGGLGWDEEEPVDPA